MCVCVFVVVVGDWFPSLSSSPRLYAGGRLDERGLPSDSFSRANRIALLNVAAASLSFSFSSSSSFSRHREDVAYFVSTTTTLVVCVRVRVCARVCVHSKESVFKGSSSQRRNNKKCQKVSFFFNCFFHHFYHFYHFYHPNRQSRNKRVFFFFSTLCFCSLSIAHCKVLLICFFVPFLLYD